MSQKKKRFLARILALLLAMTLGCPTIPVQAADVNNAVDQSGTITGEEPAETENPEMPDTGIGETPDDSTGTDVTEEATEESGGNIVVEEIEEDAAEEISAEENEEAEIEQRMNWVYVESSYLETPNTQRVVVSWGDGTESIEEMTLTVQASNGTQEEWALSNFVEDLYLFEKEYTDASQNGTYQATALTVKTEEAEKTFAMAEMEAEVLFGVNEEYAGIEELKPITEEGSEGEGAVSASVATISEEGTLEAQESIAAALEQAGAEVQAETMPAKSRAAKSRAAVSASDTRAGNIVVALDPGHDASDVGASGNGLKEEVLTLKIANYCKAELEQYAGVTVYMTRTGAACPYGKKGIACMPDRVKAAYNAGAKIFVSFHLNSFNGVAYGAEVIVPNNSWKPNVGSAGTALGNKILDELVNLGLTRRRVYSRDTTVNDTYPDGSKSDYYSVQINCKNYGIPGIIVEHAFIDNASDANKYLKTEAGLKSLGVADATGIAKYLGLSKGKWVQDENGWKFQMPNGTYVKNQFFTVGGKTYYFDANGYRLTGWQTIGGKKYYFLLSDPGVMVTGWETIGGKRYYFLLSDPGVMVTGWQTIGGKKYYFNAEGVMQQGWQTIDGKKYYFLISDPGVMVTGWQTIGGKKYYFLISDPGVMVTGWETIGGNRYYFNAEGVMQQDFQIIGGKKYYFNAEGMMQQGWQTIDGKRYYFLISDPGVMVTGFETIGGKRYYFNAEGMMQQGWQTIDGKRYYFLISDPGVMVTGFETIGGKRYYFNAEGVMQQGWQTIDGKEYYFLISDPGVMVTGWETIGGIPCYFDNNGVLEKKLEGDKRLIEGKTTKTAQQMAKLFNSKGKKYPPELSSKGADSIGKFCQIIIEEANREGISAEVVFAQTMVETGWLQFGGQVKVTQCNFAGIGAVDGGAAGASFKDVRTGLRAQVQHLKAYACYGEITTEIVDPRFDFVTRGSAPYVEWLGIQENPKHIGWASGKNYGYKIIYIMDQI